MVMTCRVSSKGRNWHTIMSISPLHQQWMFAWHNRYVTVNNINISTVSSYLFIIFSYLFISGFKPLTFQGHVCVLWPRNVENIKVLPTCGQFFWLFEWTFPAWSYWDKESRSGTLHSIWWPMISGDKLALLCFHMIHQQLPLSAWNKKHQIKNQGAIDYILLTVLKSWISPVPGWLEGNRNVKTWLH